MPCVLRTTFMSDPSMPARPMRQLTGLLTLQGGMKNLAE